MTPKETSVIIYHVSCACWPLVGDGLDPVQFGWLYVFSGIGFALGGFLNMRFVVQFGIEQMIKIGFFCQLSAGLSMLMFFFA